MLNIYICLSKKKLVIKRRIWVRYIDENIDKLVKNNKKINIILDENKCNQEFHVH